MRLNDKDITKEELLRILPDIKKTDRLDIDPELNEIIRESIDQYHQGVYSLKETQEFISEWIKAVPTII